MNFENIDNKEGKLKSKLVPIKKRLLNQVPVTTPRLAAIV